MKNSSVYSRFARWPVIVIGSFIFLFVLGVATIRESYRGYKVDQEIQALEEQARSLEGRNKRLIELTDALQSKERLEVEARKRLGLKQPGEHVVVLDGLVASSSWQDSIQMDVVAIAPETDEPNPVRWVRYFFHEQPLN